MHAIVCEIICLDWEEPEVIKLGIRNAGTTLTLISTGNVREYCLIVEGAYLSESEAEHALRDPFIEDWVEQTGHFKIHNMDEIQITPGVTLGSLGVVMLDDRSL